MISLYIALSLGTFGKLILGFTVLRVHSLIMKEKKIDALVLASMKTERYVTFFGIALIVIGYLLEILFYSTAPIL